MVSILPYRLGGGMAGSIGGGDKLASKALRRRRRRLGGLSSGVIMKALRTSAIKQTTHVSFKHIGLVHHFLLLCSHGMVAE